MILGTFWVHLGAFESARKPFIPKASGASPRTPLGGLQRPRTPSCNLVSRSVTRVALYQKFRRIIFFVAPPKLFLLYTALYIPGPGILPGIYSRFHIPGLFQGSTLHLANFAHYFIAFQVYIPGFTIRTGFTFQALPSRYYSKERQKKSRVPLTHPLFSTIVVKYSR